MSATRQTLDGRPALRFERHLAQPVERVWRAVSEPAELERWMPAAADWTPKLAEVFELGGLRGEITELDPPHLIAWTFAGQVFRCELRGEDQGCALVFTHVFDEATPAAQTAAGWECYFDRLDAHLVGGYLPEEQAHQPIGERHERYAAHFGLDPAPGRAFIASLGFRGPTLEGAEGAEGAGGSERAGGAGGAGGSDAGPTLRLERRYDQPVERVWGALTAPDELRRWFPGQLEIQHSEPPHLLVGAWQGDGTLRFELRGEGQGCLLTFTHTFTDRDQAALTGAGWDRCFARLDALLADQTMSEAASMAAWPDVHDRLANAWGIDPEIGRAVYTELAKS